MDEERQSAAEGENDAKDEQDGDEEEEDDDEEEEDEKLEVSNFNFFSGRPETSNRTTKPAFKTSARVTPINKRKSWVWYSCCQKRRICSIPRHNQRIF